MEEACSLDITMAEEDTNSKKRKTPPTSKEAPAKRGRGRPRKDPVEKKSVGRPKKKETSLLDTDPDNLIQIDREYAHVATPHLQTMLPPATYMKLVIFRTLRENPSLTSTVTHEPLKKTLKQDVKTIEVRSRFQLTLQSLLHVHGFTPITDHQILIAVENFLKKYFENMFSKVRVIQTLSEAEILRYYETKKFPTKKKEMKNQSEKVTIDHISTAIFPNTKLIREIEYFLALRAYVKETKNRAENSEEEKSEDSSNEDSLDELFQQIEVAPDKLTILQSSKSWHPTYLGVDEEAFRIAQETRQGLWWFRDQITKQLSAESYKRFTDCYRDSFTSRRNFIDFKNWLKKIDPNILIENNSIQVLGYIISNLIFVFSGILFGEIPEKKNRISTNIQPKSVKLHEINSALVLLEQKIMGVE